MSQCRRCGDGYFTLNRETGKMTCSNGHENYIGSPCDYSPSPTREKDEREVRTNYLDNNLFKKQPR